MLPAVVIVTLLVIALSGTAVGTDPRPCCVDKAFTMNLRANGFDRQTRHEITSTQFSEVYNYNYDRQLVSYDTNSVLPNGTVIRSRDIVNYNTHMQYTIDAQGRCTTAALPSDFVMPKPCLPDSATYLGQVVLGHGKDAYRLNGWRYPDWNNAGVTLSSYMTEHTCTPVYLSVQEVKNGVIQQNVAVVYADYQVGEVNPSVYEIPTNCPTAPDPDDNTQVGRR